MIQRRLLIGTTIILTGTVLLLVTTGVVSPGSFVVPGILVLAGAVFLHRAFQPDGGEINLFSGTLLSLAGLFFILQQSVLTGTELRSLWPVFMTFGGMALVVYGLRKGRSYRISLVLPGGAIIALSLVFLLFSLNVINQSLASLTARWWPIIFIPLGLLMLMPGRGQEETDRDDLLSALSDDAEDDAESQSDQVGVERGEDLR